VGEPWQPLKIYYNGGWSRDRLEAIHEAMLAEGLESPYAEWLANWKPRRSGRPTTTIECGEFFETREAVTKAFSQDQFEYYGNPAGWLDRMSLIEPADELIAAAERKGETGWYQPEHAIRALLPATIDPDKPTKDTGNFLGHRVGFLYPWDETTQVAFGLIPESYSSFKWTGVLLIPILLMLLFVHVTSRMADGYVFSVWGVYLFGRFQHSFVEQSLSTMLRELVVLPLLILIVVSAIRILAALPKVLVSPRA